MKQETKDSLILTCLIVIVFMLAIDIIGKPIVIIEKRNQSCERNSLTGEYEYIDNISEELPYFEYNISIPKSGEEIFVKCEQEIKIMVQGQFPYQWYKLCYRCKDINKSIMEGRLEAGDWLCPV